MARKSSKIIAQNAPKPKEKLSGGAKFGITVCILVLAVLGFAAAERLGMTGTKFLYRGEVRTELKEPSRPKTETSSSAYSERKKQSNESPKSEKSDDSQKSVSDSKHDSDKEKSSSSKRKKTSSSRKAATPVAPFPLAAFLDISRNPHSWPAFVRLTRSRSIAITDPQTGESFGRMDVPARTVVKVIKVNPNGMLDVFDRTGQKFQVEASGTNFAAAFIAAKNKPKKKAKKPATTVAKASAREKEAQPKPVVVTKQPQKQLDVRVSAFGSVVTDEEWDEAESED